MIFRNFISAALLLGLTLLMGLPFQAFQVSAVNSPGTTWFSPYGTRATGLIINDYSSSDAMFRAFRAGQIDITDWPANPADLSSFGSNPDFLLSQQQSEFGIFELDFNFHNDFMGAASLAARPAPPAAGVVGAITYGTASGCGVGFGRFIVNLVNKETGGVIIDLHNTLIGTGSSNPGPVTDDPLGGTSADGQYSLPGPTGCMVQGPYSLTTSVYIGTVPVSLCLNQVCAPNAASVAVTLTLGLNYNSPSTQKLDNRGTEFRKAVAHMVDKPNFDASIVGFAGKLTCNSLFAAPTQGLTVDSCFSNPSDNGCPPTGPDGVCDIPQVDLNQGESGTGGAHSAWFSGNVPKGYNLGPQAHGAGDYWWASGGRAIGVNTGYASLNNLRAACEHFMAAGFAATGTSNNANPTVACLEIATYLSQATQPAGASKNLVPNGHIEMFVRDYMPQEFFGQIVADTINATFGTPQSSGGGTVFYGTAGPTSPKYYTIDQVASTVFDATVADDWHIYTGEHMLRTTPDHLYGLRHSAFASTYCGGAGAPSPNNYIIHCDPAYDTQAAAGEFTDTLAHANNFFTVAALVGFHTVNEVPMFSRYQQFVALNGWSLQDTGTPTASSLVQSLGEGWRAGGRGAFFSLLNMRQKTGSQTICTSPGTPAGCTTNPAYLPGGGPDNLPQGANGEGIRRGLSQGVRTLSVFHATTPWEFDVIDEVYDSMLRTNPLTGGATNQVIDWMTTKHSQVVGPISNTCVPIPPTARPNTQPVCSDTATTQTWFLRNDLRFHDGTLVTAADVAFSIQAYRDVPSDKLLPAVQTVATINVLGSNTLQVVLLNQSPFYELNIGGLPIVKKGTLANPNSWVSKCTAGGVIGGAGNACANPADDPMFTGRYVGSGPWMCISLYSGFPGGSCSSDADGLPSGQTLGLGGTIQLRGFDRYMRCCPNEQGTSLQKSSWADVDKNGVVNILDIANIALYFGQSAASCGANSLCQHKVAYWDSPIFGGLPPAACNVNCVDIVEIATVAFYFDHGLTAPFTPAQISDGLDPSIDPFANLAGGAILEYQAFTGNFARILVPSGSTPSSYSMQAYADNGTLLATAQGRPDALPEWVDFDFPSGAFSASTNTPEPTYTILGVVVGLLGVTVGIGAAAMWVSSRRLALGAKFGWSPGNPSLGQEVTFTAKAWGGTPPYSYSWNFGANQGASATNPAKYTYSQCPTYSDEQVGPMVTVSDSAKQPAEFSFQRADFSLSNCP